MAPSMRFFPGTVYTLCVAKEKIYLKNKLTHNKPIMRHRVMRFLFIGSYGGGNHLFSFSSTFFTPWREANNSRVPHTRQWHRHVILLRLLVLSAQRKCREIKKFLSSSGTVKNVNENHFDNRVESCIDSRQKHNRSCSSSPQNEIFQYVSVTAPGPPRLEVLKIKCYIII